MITDNLFSPIKLGRFNLKNRLIMAPMTRNRIDKDGIPNELNALYYSQRASAGLIITEGVTISSSAIGYANTPGIYTPQQINGWFKVTDSVHAKRGLIFAQLWHVGAISHPSFQPNGELPIAPSAIKPEGEAYTYEGPQPFQTPRALETAEISRIVDQFRQAAFNAKSAGFDGVEIHGAYGYLLDQFLRKSTNQRTDQYGGSPQNRARLILEVVAAVNEVLGNDRVGLRISPNVYRFGMHDTEAPETFSYLIEQLNPFKLAYLHVVNDESQENKNVTLSFIRQHYHHHLIVNGGYDKTRAEESLRKHEIDAVVLGVPFLSNPDLPERFRLNLPLNAVDSTTFYSGGEKGYTDYPYYSAQTLPAEA